VIILSVADVWMPPTASKKGRQHAIDIQRNAALACEAARAQALQAVEGARTMGQTRPHRSAGVAVEAVADSPAWGIIKTADEWKADLIVVGSHGYSAVSRFLLGSVSQRVLTTAGQSVRIARASNRPQEAPVQLLLGVDGSAEAKGMVRTVANRVWRPGSVAHLIAVMDLPLLGGALA
jgi:nucleotide-binding universal stress UspA family protein